MQAFKCPKCGTTTSSNDQFCPECGQGLDIICANEECDFSIRHMYADEYKFCPKCGGKLSLNMEV
jgi:ribosomal protein S27AE